MPFGFVTYEVTLLYIKYKIYNIIKNKRVAKHPLIIHSIRPVELVSNNADKMRSPNANVTR